MRRARTPWLLLAVVVAATLSVPGVLPAGADPERAPAPVPGAGTERPRLLHGPGQEPDLRARLAREPYRTIFLRMHQRAAGWQSAPLGDHGVAVQRNLTRVAKVRAFQYALDRTVVAGEIVPFPDADARRAAGDQARDILLQILDRSRLAVPPPIGGWDRDISTSEEIVSSATAYDSLVGAGYPLSAADDAEIVRRLASVTRELRLNFVEPATASGYADLHQNNHRTKSGAAMALAAVALADQVPDARAWFDTGVDYIDDTLRHVLVTGDGAYGEGPFYYRYLTQNLGPFMAVWERFLGTDPWTTEAGIEIPALGHHPVFARSQRWMLDTSVPDGTMAPIDDGNPGRSHFGGVLPPWLPTAAASAWQWARTPQPYDTDGNVDLSPDSIVIYDDSIAAAPPDWDPTQVYVEGGTATLRSGWDADATMALVLGEHDTASEFGRDRDGVGRWPQSHEHADPGSFLFHAYGERLALDPGYLTFPTRAEVNRPEHHNVVLVDGRGPPDYLQASLAWRLDLAARPPAEGQSTLTAPVASEAGDAVSVVSHYRDTGLHRRVLMGDDRYLVVADALRAPEGADLTWMLHGNGGGTSGGAYERTAAGGRWTIGGARLDSGIATTAGPPGLDEVEAVHEVPFTQRRTHTALAATAPAGAGPTGAVQILYPTPSGGPAPTLVASGFDGHAGLTLADAAGDRRVTVVRRGPAGGDLTADGASSDGDLLVVERHLDGRLRSVWAEGSTRIGQGGTTLVLSPTSGTLALRLDGDAVHLVADTDSPTVEVRDLGFVPAGIDGGCGIAAAGDGATTVRLNRERTATLVATAAPGRPAADAGRTVRVEPGTTVTLDGTASCDADGEALTARWELVSAPAGSTWTLDGADTWRPRLRADRVGPYRARLVVTDAGGRLSREAEVLVKVGSQCADGIDDDLDGLIDTDDPDCDGPPSPPPPPMLSPTQAYVTLLYRDLLGRSPEPDGLAYWAALLDGGASRSTVLARFRRTPEINRRAVRTLYRTYLGRDASLADLAHWTAYLARGRDLADLEVELMASTEFRTRAGGTNAGLVVAAHGAVLDRAPTARELAIGTERVERAGRAAFLRDLLRSEEGARRRVTLFYRALLGREPDAAGLDFWAARLVAGGGVLNLLFALAATQEYATQVPRVAGDDVVGRALAG